MVLMVMRMVLEGRKSELGLLGLMLGLDDGVLGRHGVVDIGQGWWRGRGGRSPQRTKRGIHGRVQYEGAKRERKGKSQKKKKRLSTEKRKEKKKKRQGKKRAAEVSKGQGTRTRFKMEKRGDQQRARRSWDMTMQGEGE